MYWTKERCLISARKFANRSSWIRSEPSAYGSAMRNGWGDECCAHMVRLRAERVSWTKGQCIEIAKKYATRTEWSDASVSYRYAVSKGWLKECAAHMPALKNGTKRTVKSCADNARSFPSRKAWRESKGSSYSKARSLGIAHRFFKNHKWYHKEYGTWTVKQLIQWAKKFKTRTEWFTKSNATYKVAKNKGCFERCCSHMPDRFGRKSC